MYKYVVYNYKNLIEFYTLKDRMCYFNIIIAFSTPECKYISIFLLRILEDRFIRGDVFQNKIPLSRMKDCEEKTGFPKLTVYRAQVLHYVCM